MDLEIRPVEEDEFAAYAATVEGAFGETVSDQAVADWRSMAELDRTLAVFDEGAIVGTAGAFTFEMTVPGLAAIPAAGVTAVGVRTTHRRRGLLRSMMERQLDDVAARGEPVAILTASESAIYGRFGYGWATSQAGVSIDPRHGAFAAPLADHGTVRVLSKEEARRLLPEVHDRARRLVPGDINRSDAWWDVQIADREHDRHGASGAFLVVHRDPTGVVDGWLIYRVRPSWKHGLPDNTVEVSDLGATDAIAEVALWRYLLDIDLTVEVRAYSRPVDEPVRAWLADPRRFRTTMWRDDIWVRVLDVPGALAARRYVVDGELVLEVIDHFRPQQSGRYHLVGGRDGATCAPTDRQADLTITVADLGAAYLGNPRFRLLARSGLADEHRGGAAGRADVMFGADETPFCRTGF